MNSVILSKTYKAPPFCEKEILRYAGCRKTDCETQRLLKECIDEARSKLVYKVCFTELPVRITESLCDFGSFSCTSEKLAKNLNGCRTALLFGATVGVEIDRLIAKYGRLSPAKALMFQALGAERIEALCDTFCKEYISEKDVALKPRFSPGYGDLSLTVQREIFSNLDCSRKIGLCLNDSLLMSPSKSVTAFAGIAEKNEMHQNDKCAECHNTNCLFRSSL